MKRATLRGGLAALVTVLLAPASWTAVINVDVEQLTDVTHTGSDGLLASGPTWNSVLFDTDRSNLFDSMSNATTVGVVYLRTFPPALFVDANSTNDLQDTGTLAEGFEIRNLVAGNTYTLVVYAGQNSGFGIVDLNGTQGGFCNIAGAPTYVLPGVVGRDYCRYDGLEPFDLGGGVFGIRIEGVDGSITGFQLEGAFSGSTDTTPPSCTLSGTNPGPPASIDIETQDSGSGIATINVLVASNAVVTIPAFTSGTTSPVVVNAEQIVDTFPSMVELETIDVEGNTSTCAFTIPAASSGTCDDILVFFDDAVANGNLVGRGAGNSANGRRSALRHMIENACQLIANNQVNDACDQLQAALRKTDGDPQQPDFVAGNAASDLADRIRDLRTSLGCANKASLVDANTRSKPVDERSWGLVKNRYRD